MIIKGNLDLRNSNIESLGELTQVNGYLNLFECKDLKSLGNIKKIKDALVLYGCENLKNLGKLKYCGKILIYNSRITETYIKQYKPDLIGKIIYV